MDQPASVIIARKMQPYNNLVTSSFLFKNSIKFTIFSVRVKLVEAKDMVCNRAVAGGYALLGVLCTNSHKRLEFQKRSGGVPLLGSSKYPHKPEYRAGGATRLYPTEGISLPLSTPYSCKIKAREKRKEGKNGKNCAK